MNYKLFDKNIKIYSTYFYILIKFQVKIKVENFTKVKLDQGIKALLNYIK